MLTEPFQRLLNLFPVALTTVWAVTQEIGKACVWMHAGTTSKHFRQHLSARQFCKLSSTTFLSTAFSHQLPFSDSLVHTVTSTEAALHVMYGFSPPSPLSFIHAFPGCYLVLPFSPDEITEWFFTLCTSACPLALLSLSLSRSDYVLVSSLGSALTR